LELSWCRVSFLKGDLQFSKFLKNTICIGLCKLKCTEKCFIPFPPIHFLPEFVPHTEFKGRPVDTKRNVLYHTALRNYAAISLQVPSILSILLVSAPFPSTLQCDSDRKRAGMKQISEVEEKPFKPSLNICPEARDGIFKSFRSPGIDSEESIPPAYVST
jgi:hypothetical protein